MRIGIDALPLLRSRTTGIQNHARGLCRSLAELAPQDEFLLFYERSARSLEDFDDSFVQSLGPNWRVVTGWVPGPTPRIARFCWQAWALPRLLERHAVRVYYSCTTHGPYRGRCPYAITIHDLAKEACGKNAAAPRDVSRLAERAERVFAVSEATARDVQRLLGVSPDRLVTIHDAPAIGIAPVPPERQEAFCRNLGLSRGKFLLCVGDENWRRRYDVLWQAMESLWAASRLQDIRVVFIGRQDWKTTNLFAMVASSSSHGGLFLSNVRDEDLSALYSSAAATVLPTEAEGFGMPAVEAMVCRCPVVCSDIPVLHEVAGDAARYFNLALPDELSEAVASVVSDEKLRSEMVRRGLERASGYTWGAAAAKVLSSLRAVANPGGTAAQ